MWTTSVVLDLTENGFSQLRCHRCVKCQQMSKFRLHFARVDACVKLREVWTKYPSQSEGRSLMQPFTKHLICFWVKRGCQKNASKT